MAMKKRIVIVGLGSIGRRHARLLSERNDVEVELLDLNPENLSLIQELIGPQKTFTNFDEMIASKPDMAVIATPHALHAKQAIATLEAGIDTLCEKPMSDNLADAKRMHEASERSSGQLVIGFNMHFHPCLLAVKKIIDSGRLGKILHLHSRIGTYATLVNSGSRYQAEIEGALVMDYAHQPDIFQWLTRETPRYVYASASESGKLPLSAKPNFVLMNYEYESGMLGSVHLNYVQEPARHGFEIVGSDAWLILDIFDDNGMLTLGTRSDAKTKSETIPFIRDNMYRAEHAAFIDTVAGNRDPESPASSAILSVAVCDAAIRSWITHKRIQMDIS